MIVMWRQLLSHCHLVQIMTRALCLNLLILDLMIQGLMTPDLMIQGLMTPDWMIQGSVIQGAPPDLGLAPDPPARLSQPLKSRTPLSLINTPSSTPSSATKR